MQNGHFIERESAMNQPSPQAVRNLVVATDLSPAADVAVERAVRLARQWQAGLCLLHVFNDGFWATIKTVYQGESWAQKEPLLVARDRLSRQVRTLGERYGVAVRGETRSGRAAATIAEFLQSQEAQLLVVGEHGEDWIGDTVVGGTALKVLAAANLPVLLVRRPASADFANVLIATDFSAPAGRAAHLAAAWFPAGEATLLYAYFVPFEGRMRMAGAMDEDIARYRSDEHARAQLKLQQYVSTLRPAEPERLRALAMRGEPAATVVEQAKLMNADLIVIGKHGGGALGERLLGSVTQNVLYHSPCDVLVVP